MLFPRITFDAVKCQQGLEALRAYRWAFNDRMGELKTTPVHDWSSHGADAFRYLAIAAKIDMGAGLKLAPLKYPRMTV